MATIVSIPSNRVKGSYTVRGNLSGLPIWEGFNPL